jgi:hypothetical protein
MIMSDDDVEAMLRGLVEEHLAEDARKTAIGLPISRAGQST